MLVCDGLKGLPDAVNAVWEKTIVQTCIVHLLRNSFKYASKRDWGVIAKTSSPSTRQPRKQRRWTGSPSLRQVGETLPSHHPAVGERLGRVRALPGVRPGNPYRDLTTNAIESINARLRRAVNARGHFPTEQAALKCLYLAIMSLDPTGRAANAGPTGGRPPSTPSISPSTAASAQEGSNNQDQLHR